MRSRAGSGSAVSSLNLGYRPWDLVERVNENRRQFLSAVGLGDATLATLHQVHSNRVLIIEDSRGEWNQPEGDALITAAEGVALAVQVADCLPVLIADPVKRAIAAVHSGWRGTLSGVLTQTIREMEKVFGSRAQDLTVAIGPGIRQCCFEVGSDVADLFEKKYPASGLATPARSPDKFFLDLPRTLDIQLDMAGVQERNRHDMVACTRCRAGEFFSHRAEGSTSGRMMALIGILERHP